MRRRECAPASGGKGWAIHGRIHQRGGRLRCTRVRCGHGGRGIWRGLRCPLPGARPPHSRLVGRGCHESAFPRRRAGPQAAMRARSQCTRPPGRGSTRSWGLRRVCGHDRHTGRRRGTGELAQSASTWERHERNQHRADTAGTETPGGRRGQTATTTRHLADTPARLQPHEGGCRVRGCPSWRETLDSAESSILVIQRSSGNAEARSSALGSPFSPSLAAVLRSRRDSVVAASPHATCQVCTSGHTNEGQLAPRQSKVRLWLAPRTRDYDSRLQCRRTNPGPRASHVVAVAAGALTELAPTTPRRRWCPFGRCGEARRLRARCRARGTGERAMRASPLQTAYAAAGRASARRPYRMSHAHYPWHP